MKKTSKAAALNPLDLLSFSRLRRVPLILQSEISECGLACLAMISSFYGHRANVTSLREIMTLGSQGMNLNQMISVAGNLGLSARGVRCDMEDINNLSMPCVLHWNLDHFIVLTKVSGNHAYINDPAFGKRKVSLEQFGDSFTGVALELKPTTDFKKADRRKTIHINQLWERMSGAKRTMGTLLLLSLLLQISALMSPYYMQWVVDITLLSNDKPLLIVLAVGFAFLKLTQVLIGAFRAWVVIRFSSALNIQMGANLFQHMIRLPLSYFEKRHVGDVVSRFGSIHAIRELLTTGLVETVIDGVMAITVLIVMYLYHPMLATLVLGFVLISLIAQVLFYYPNRRVTEESITASAKGDSSFLESIRAIQTIKLFSHESSRQNNWLNRYAEIINTDIRLGRLSIAEDALTGLLSGLESILVVYFAALAVMDGELTVGMLLAFIAYKAHFTSSSLAFIDNVISFKLLGLHLERLSDIALEEKEGSVNNVRLPSNIKGQLKVEGLSFRYADNEPWILKSVSLEVLPGECVVITGPSGCGKTTLMKILLGLLKPTEGVILFDGIDIASLDLREYRSRIGSVMQPDTLLSGTLAENITMFDSNFDEKKMMDSCEIACISDDISQLAMGYHSLVGDMGGQFSGGQLQRLFLARALYKNPTLLCLDESSSHLDDHNEFQVNKNLSDLGITKIVVAHRKQTIDQGDRVIDLAKKSRN